MTDARSMGVTESRVHGKISASRIGLKNLSTVVRDFESLGIGESAFQTGKHVNIGSQDQCKKSDSDRNGPTAALKNSKKSSHPKSGQNWPKCSPGKKGPPRGMKTLVKGQGIAEKRNETPPGKDQHNGKSGD
jgi:hypothetical protein